jgi:hypothetical protein
MRLARSKSKRKKKSDNLVLPKKSKLALPELLLRKQLALLNKRIV